MGNRLSKTNETPPIDNETTNYTYDDENRLTKVTITKNSKQKELTFTYDPFGRRITKTLTKDEIGTDCTAPNVCPRTTTYVYDNQSIIAEYDTNGEVQNRYTHGPGIDEPLAIEVKTGATYTPYYYHADGLGSIMSISNASGAVVQRYVYDSFGNMVITTNGNINQPYTYTSREYDVETGMYFYRARYYDPKVGRFVTKDPIGFAGGINVFSYASSNPVNFMDPEGLDVYVCYYSDAAAGFGHVGFGFSSSSTTSGFYPTGNPFNSRGIIKTDKQKDKICKTIDSPPNKDKCMQDCLDNRTKQPGQYRIQNRQCTSFVRDCLKECGLPAGDYNGPHPGAFFRRLPDSPNE